MACSPSAQCPKAPDVNADRALPRKEQEHAGKDGTLTLESEDWNLEDATAMGALKLLISAVQALADTTGEIPPTPPMSRPQSPNGKHPASPEALTSTPTRLPMSPISPVSPTAQTGPAFIPIPMPSPEAHRDEPLPHIDIGANTQSILAQQAAISRRFFLKTVPPFSLSEYLLRIHTHCPHSPGVYLVAATYIHRLCVEDGLVPATSKTIHRVCLAAIRVASKAFEDHKWSQDRFSKVGGVSKKEMKSLEVNLCFLLGFELFVREADLKRRVFRLQQKAKQSHVVKKRLSDDFRMRLPLRDGAS